MKKSRVKRFYSLREVAVELGKSPATIKYHRYVSRYFADIGVVIGKSLIYSEADIETMRAKFARMPKPGGVHRKRQSVPPGTKIRKVTAIAISGSGAGHRKPNGIATAQHARAADLPLGA